VFWTYATGETPLILCAIIKIDEVGAEVGINVGSVDGTSVGSDDGMILGFEDGKILETIDG